MHVIWLGNIEKLLKAQFFWQNWINPPFGEGYLVVLCSSVHTPGGDLSSIYVEEQHISNRNPPNVSKKMHNITHNGDVHFLATTPFQALGASGTYLILCVV